MAAFDPYPPYSATAALADLEIVSIDHHYDGTVVIRARERQRFSQTYATGDLPSWYQPLPMKREIASFDAAVRRHSMRPHCFPAEARAPIQTHTPKQAPRARPTPVQRLHHFASPKVWARRNKPTPRKDET